MRKLILFFAFLLLVPFANGQLDNPKLRSDLKELEHIGVISDLLKHLSEETGTIIKVSKTLENVPIAVFCRHQTVKELLERLAKVLDYEWVIVDGSLLLQESDEQRKEYEVTLREQILSAYKLQQRELSNWSKALNKEKGAIAKARLDDLQKQMNELHSRSSEPTDWAHYHQISVEIAQLRRILNPSYPIVAEFLSRIPDEVLLELDYQGRVVFSTAPTEWQKPAKFNNDLLRRYISDKVDQRKAERDNAFENGQTFILNSPNWVAFSESDVHAIRLSVKRLFERDMRGQFSHAKISLLDFDGRKLCDDSLFLSSFVSRDPLKKSSPDRMHPIFSRWIEVNDEPGYLCVDPERRRSYVRDRWKELNQDDKYVEYLHLWAKVLFSLAERVGLNVICELSDSYGENPEEFPPAKYDQSTKRHEMNAGAYLDNVCSLANWEIDEKWLKVWPINRSLARHSRIPRDVLRQVHHYCRSVKGIHLDYLSSVIAKLNDRSATSYLLQNALMNSFEFEYSLPADFVLSSLRLWANLTESQKLSLLSGQPVRFIALSPEARRHLTKALLHIRFSHATFLDLDVSNREDIIRWVQDNWTHLWQSPDEITQVFPNGPDERVTLGYALAQTPAIFLVGDLVSGYRSISWFASYVNSFLEGTLLPQRQYQFLLGVNNLHFITIGCADEFASGVCVQTRHLAPGSVKINVTDLPPEIKKIVDDYRARMGGGD